MAERVIPYALNYADVKPEAMENMLKLHRFTPVATVQYADPDTVVRFNLQSSGFLDPYSTYVKITVKITNDAWAQVTAGDLPRESAIGYCLDRSAHSFFNRLVIKSYGTEIERIEEYDVLAALINDVHYSNEYKLHHFFEGFPKSEAYHGQAEYVNTANCYMSVAGIAAISELLPHSAAATSRSACDYFFGRINNGWTGDATAPDVVAGLTGLGIDGYVPIVGAAPLAGPAVYLTTSQSRTFCIPIYSGILGILMPDKKLLPLSLMPLEVEFTINPYALYAVGGTLTQRSPYQVSKIEIYGHMFYFETTVHRAIEAAVAEAGLFLHFNSFRLGPISTNTGGPGSGINQVALINVYDKSINSIHFVFMYTNYRTVPHARKLNFVSHNLRSLYIRNGTDYLPSEPIYREVESSEYNFLQYIMELYKAWNKMHSPALDSGLTPFNFQQDAPLYYNAEYYAVPGAAIGMPYQRMFQNNAKTGRCQYAISLEGEQLGSNKMIISGKQGYIPFDILYDGTKASALTSVQLVFVRADYILYIRPDLVVTVLGK